MQCAGGAVDPADAAVWYGNTRFQSQRQHRMGGRCRASRAEMPFAVRTTGARKRYDFVVLDNMIS